MLKFEPRKCYINLIDWCSTKSNQTFNQLNTIKTVLPTFQPLIKTLCADQKDLRTACLLLSRYYRFTWLFLNLFLKERSCKIDKFIFVVLKNFQYGYNCSEQQVQGQAPVHSSCRPPIRLGCTNPWLPTAEHQEPIIHTRFLQHNLYTPPAFHNPICICTKFKCPGHNLQFQVEAVRLTLTASSRINFSYI